MCHSGVHLNSGTAQRRDEEYSAFVAASSRRLVHVATLISGDRHRGEDLAQSALVAVYVKWPSIRDDPFPYARRCVVNAHVSWWKRVAGREAATADVPDNSRDDGTASVDARHALVAALKTLTRREREVLVLRYVEDLSEEQTAAELG